MYDNHQQTASQSSQRGSMQSVRVDGLRSDEPKRAPQISIQLDILGKEISCETEELNSLADRLQPALSLGPPETDQKDTLIPSEPTSAIANSLWSMSRQVARNAHIVRELKSRLEM